MSNSTGQFRSMTAVHVIFFYFFTFTSMLTMNLSSPQGQNTLMCLKGDIHT